MKVSKFTAGSRAGSFLALRQAVRDADKADAEPQTPGAHYRPIPRAWRWREVGVGLTMVLLLGLWCTLTLQARQLDRAHLTLRGASRRAADTASALEAANYTDSGALLTRASDCARRLAIPQVALLFLVKGTISHEVTWASWLGQLSGLIPGERHSNLGAGRALDCGPTPTPGLHPTVAEQNLFTLYVHAQREQPAAQPGSLFHGAYLPRQRRVTTDWGTHSLVTATKALLLAALEEQLNTKFLLLSETTLPVYSPFLLYRQLLSSSKSSLNACNETRWYRAADQRWTPEFESPNLKLHHWRKSWQWFALNRAHAGLVVGDREIEAQFEAHCRPTWVPEWKNYRVCYSDEHYIPTLLAVHGLDNETDCAGDTTGDIHLGLLPAVRHSERPHCSHGPEENRAARAGFLLPSDGLGEGEEARVAGAAAAATSFRPLGRHCPLLARKFMPPVVPQVLGLLLRCRPEIAVLNGGTCHEERGLSHRLAGAAQPWAGASALAAAAALLAGLGSLLAQASLRRGCVLGDQGSPGFLAPLELA